MRITGGRRRVWLAAALCGAAATKAIVVGAVSSATEAPGPAPTVAVAANQLVDQSGRPLRLLGVNRGGTQIMCARGTGIFQGPSDRASVAAMASWHINTVRLPLNQSCWLGLHGVDPRFGGAAYRAAIVDYVKVLHEFGLVAILELHISSPGQTLATTMQVMADADHSPAFWRSVASHFKNDRSVVFDLFNEPHDISWTCWRDGCRTAAGWQAAGMQSLVDAVRSTGAAQPLLVGGLAFSSDLSRWREFRPRDPLNQLAAGFHTYPRNRCAEESCWESVVAQLAATTPVIAGEVGQHDCRSDYTTRFTRWADRHRISYLGWAWTTYDCSRGPALIECYDGTPTPFGAGFRDAVARSRGLSPPGSSSGYVMTTSDGATFGFGTATTRGSPSNLTLSAPIAGIAATRCGDSYWLTATDGGVFAFGNARFYGSTGAVPLNQPIVGSAALKGGGGYWLVGSDGGVFAFGAARFHGSTGDLRLNQPVVGLAATASESGYWLVAADGGVFAFGDARFYGSTSAIRLNQPIVGVAPSPTGKGYWLVASDGGVFASGDAQYYGSTGSIPLNEPIVDIASTPTGRGYWLFARDGGVFSFGDGKFHGSAAGRLSSRSVVAATSMA